MLRRAALILLLPCAALAEKPVFDGLFPAGAPRGSTNAVTLFGKFDPWPPSVWSSGEGLAFNFETNKGKVAVTVSPNAAPGPRLLRFHNAEGASEARFFVVGAESEELEREPNDHFRRAHSVTNLPVVINGRLEKNGDADSYALSLRAGEWLDARLESYVIMSKLDPVLRLLTTNGFQLAWNHDFGSLDPRLIWRSPKDQTVILQVFGFAYPADAQIQLSGGAGGFYRLALSHDAPHKSPPSKPPQLAIGGSVSGEICRSGQQDIHPIAPQKGQWIEARVAAFDIGSPLDAWLAIQDSAGKELSRSDDSDNTRDPRLEWQVPADGEYRIVVGSVSANPPEKAKYLLSLRQLGPAFSAKLPQDTITLAAGATNELKLTLQRLRGHTNQLTASFASLPEGLSAPEVTDTKGGELKLLLTAATNAPAWSGPVRVRIQEAGGGEPASAEFDLISRTENNGVPGGYLKLLIPSVQDIWLTVTAAPTNAVAAK